MAEPWTFAEEVARVSSPGGSTLTLVEGSSFCIADAAGDVLPGAAAGLFFLDTRFLSQLELRVDGRRTESLGVSVDDPFAAVHLCRVRARAGQADSGLVVFRRRWVGYGLRDVIELRSFDDEPRVVTVELLVASDFADLFAVKEGRARRRGAYGTEIRSSSICFSHRNDGHERAVEVALTGAPDVDGDGARWQVELAPGEVWTAEVVVSATVDGERVPTRVGAAGERPVHAAAAGPADLLAAPGRRLDAWRRATPTVRSDSHALSATVQQSLEDLGALRIFDPAHPELPVVAAGAPWFMTLFGRDSLITAWMALPADVDLARGVVETLARLQGERVDDETEEEPGKILHELRFGKSTTLSLGAGEAYYGSVDATPLFVMLLGELRRWGLEPDVVDRLLPHADRALEWIESYGDRDGDGYVEYERRTPQGLANQGWKDSWDGIRYADGRVADAPLALCEVQGYVYAAYLARAFFADEAGDDELAARFRARAIELKERFNRDFWLPERGWFAVALDAEKRPVDSLASNMAHCLWTGIIDEAKAPQVAAHLASPAMCSGWGLRTLGSNMPAYNPVSYHCGSVWPHDSAIAVAGLMRYGFVAEAHRIIEGLLDVAARQGWRLPELFAGFDRDELGVPAAYPTSCVPQAWAAAAPLSLVRSMLRLDPWLPRRKVWVAPALPPSVGRIRVEGLRLGDSDVTIDVGPGGCVVEGLPPDVELVEEARRPLSASVRGTPT